ncbi:hypothetical protein T12_2971 [Trichinella patagoniensis]|uniref:Uncharacterized protein n=1 Tax=Trichinella patagoniensis TaxID=990121 RepID=A0A0V0ZTX6_9BILA|nr:hypothetical protein T12_2971 [Trichinella patagoniensis]
MDEDGRPHSCLCSPALRRPTFPNRSHRPTCATSYTRDIPPQQFAQEGLVQLTTAVNSPRGQLSVWSSHRDYLCLWHSLKSGVVRLIYEGGGRI